MSYTAFINEWLKPKLRSLEFDEDIFGNYILGILTSDETEDEKRESLEGLLAEAISTDVSVLCLEICEKWTEANKTVLENKKIAEDEKNNFDEILVNIMEKQVQSVKKLAESTESEKKLKEAILAHYSQVSDEDEDETSKALEKCTLAANSSGTAIPVNNNTACVINAEKESREKAKADAEKKKTQDKINREKQKQKQQERKEKERKRTQKGEHRR